MKQKKRKKSIKGKLIMITSVILAVVLTAGLFGIYHFSNKESSKVMVDRAIERVTEMAEHVEYIIDSKGYDIEELQKFVEEKAKRTNIAYAIVVDTNSKAVAHSDKAKINKVYEGDEYVKDAVQNGNVKNMRFYADVQKIWTYDIMIPIKHNGELVGAISVGIPEEGIKEIALSMIKVNIFMSSIAFLEIILLMILVFNNISKLMEKLLYVIDKINNLELDNDEHRDIMERNDEMGRMATAIFNMRDKLRNVITSISEHADIAKISSEDLSKLSHRTAENEQEIFRAIEQISQGTEIQANDAQRSAAKMSELAENIDKIIINTSIIEKEIYGASNMSIEGYSIVDGLSAAADKNKIMSNKIGAIVKDVDSNIIHITNIIEMINEIAAKTNMLALNAAIESARAGEAGRGFAVVAEEIRRLAEQTTEFTTEIEEKINDIQNKSNEAVEAVNQNITSSDNNTKMVNETEIIFNKISTVLKELKNKVDYIAENASEIDNKKNNVMQSIQDMSALSEETAASVQEISAQSTERTNDIEILMEHTIKLEKISDDLYKEINKFKM